MKISEEKTYNLIVLDTEGLNDVTNNKFMDQKLISLIYSLSSFLIMNVQSCISMLDVKNFKILQNLKANGEAPVLLYLLRDFNLTLTCPLKTYILSNFQKEIKSKNIQLEGFTLSTPCDDIEINLSKLSDNPNVLRSEFKKSCSILKEFIFQNLPVKYISKGENRVQCDGITYVKYINSLETTELTQFYQKTVNTSLMDSKFKEMEKFLQKKFPCHQMFLVDYVEIQMKVFERENNYQQKMSEFLEKKIKENESKFEFQYKKCFQGFQMRLKEFHSQSPLLELKETIAEFVLSNPFTFFNFQSKTITKPQFTDDQYKFVLGKYYGELNIDIMKWELNEKKKRNIPRYIVQIEEILNIRNQQLSKIKEMSENILKLKEILRNQSNDHSLKIRQMRESFNQSINQLQQETYIIENQFHPFDQNVINELSWKYQCQINELSTSLKRVREQLAYQLQSELESYRNRIHSNRYHNPYDGYY
jgi:hypothetical protein